MTPDAALTHVHTDSGEVNMGRECAFWMPRDERRERYDGWRCTSAMGGAVVF